MIVGNDQSWCLLMPPKTASTALTAFFSNPYFDATATKRQHTMDPPKGARILYNVRNPYDRAVSLWRHRLSELCCSSEDLPFPGYMEQVIDGKLPPFFSFTLTRWAQWFRPEVLIRFEHLIEDLAEELPQFDWEGVEIPFRNRNKVLTEDHSLVGTEWSSWKCLIVANPLVDRHAQKLVLRWCREDFERFGYPVEYQA